MCERIIPFLLPPFFSKAEGKKTPDDLCDQIDSRFLLLLNHKFSFLYNNLCRDRSQLFLDFKIV